MKKLFFGVVLLTVLSACNKEAKVTETTDAPTTDSVNLNESESSMEPVVLFKHVELNQDETSSLLGKKENDTLYVTNFWATWCPPCIREIPHFKEKMTELRSQPVKFTFVSLDPKEDWDTKVKKFAEENGLSNNVILLDGSTLTSEFFSTNFKQWDGGSIPFTFMRKGDKTDETVGMMSMEALTEKINSFK
jgi:thiol-disulfide isomerase/thioredoxin